MAAIVYLNVEYFLYEFPSPIGLSPAQAGRAPDVLNYAWREYGMRAGIWRLMDVLDRHDVPVTVGLNSEVCRSHPDVVEACVARGWEIANHGVTNSVQLYGLAADEQRAVIRESSATIEAFTGTRPHGWLGPGLAETGETLQILVEAGFGYVGDWGIADDRPFYLAVGHGNLLAVPYSLETNDLVLYLLQYRDTNQALQQITDQFETLRAEASQQSKVFALVLHPYLSGVPHRIAMLDRFFGHVRQLDGVWWAQARQLEVWYRRHVGAINERDCP